METEKIGIHLRDVFNGGIIGLTFMFDMHDPVDIHVSWINTGDELDSVEKIYSSLTNESPAKVEVDEEGESVIIIPQPVPSDPRAIKLIFKAERRTPFDTFTATVARNQLKVEFEQAIKRYKATKAS